MKWKVTTRMSVPCLFIWSAIGSNRCAPWPSETRRVWGEIDFFAQNYVAPWREISSNWGRMRTSRRDAIGGGMGNERSSAEIMSPRNEKRWCGRCKLLANDLAARQATRSERGREGGTKREMAHAGCSLNRESESQRLTYVGRGRGHRIHKEQPHYTLTPLWALSRWKRKSPSCGDPFNIINIRGAKMDTERRKRF